MKIQVLDEKQLLINLNASKNPFFNEYLAFYSSWFGGIVKNPQFMLLPIDDHMVHRGDGVFEAMKAVQRSVYLMEEHLERLLRSAAALALKPAFSKDEIKQIILATLQAADQTDASIRVFLSRGPGNFSVNPYDSIGAQLYVVVMQLNAVAAKKYEKGVSLGISSVPIKDSWIAQVKSCNYLPNVMMKKEAVERGFDFVINVDDRGYVAEGATENIMIVDQQDTIVHPELDYILKGTTMIRACELANEQGIKSVVKAISLEDLKSAKEVIITGTSLDVLPVVDFEGHKISDGKPGPIARKLCELIRKDMRTGTRLTAY